MQSHLRPTLKLVVLMVFQMEFFKTLIPCEDELEESENESNISSSFKCFKIIISHIWNSDFPKSWNNASIVSIH